MSHSSQQPSEPAYYIEDCWIFIVFYKTLALLKKDYLSDKRKNGLKEHTGHQWKFRMSNVPKKKDTHQTSHPRQCTEVNFAIFRPEDSIKVYSEFTG